MSRDHKDGDHRLRDIAKINPCMFETMVVQFTSSKLLFADSGLNLRFFS